MNRSVKYAPEMIVIIVRKLYLKEEVNIDEKKNREKYKKIIIYVHSIIIYMNM